jgi:hypothetical protein
MLALMLDLRFKNICLDISYVSHKNVAKLIFVFDLKLFILLLLLEFYKSLMPNVLKCINGFQGLVSHHRNKSKHIKAPCVKRDQWIPPSPH